jgi:hypothetical protein
MTREVMGPAPAAPAAGADLTADFDLGELERADAPRGPRDREALADRWRRWRSRSWPVWSWSALAVVVLLASVAGFAGWHVGGQRSRDQAEARISANPPVIAWLVDNGVDPSSGPDDAREAVELHVLNVGPDPVQLRAVSAQSEGGHFVVHRPRVAASLLPNGDASVTTMVLAASCDGDYTKASVSVGLARVDSHGTERLATVKAGGEPSLGSAVPDLLSQLCASPVPGQQSPGGVDIAQTSGTSGATVTVTNSSAGPRQVELTSDESPAFALVQSEQGPQELRPGQSLDLRVRVRVLKCNAIVGLQDWASTISLEVTHRGESVGDSATSDVSESYPLGDLVLVPGGAAIQKACNP